MSQLVLLGKNTPLWRGRQRQSCVPFQTARPRCRARAPAKVRAVSEQGPAETQMQRRNVLLLLLAGATVAAAPAQAFTPPPSGFRVHVDKLDGYYFLFPDTWTPVTISGNDIFYRNQMVAEENLFVNVTSPSSSRFDSVTDLGTPEDAAKKLLDQYLTREFMSTRIGIRREGEIVSAVERVASDGNTYYDIDIELRSFGSKSPYVVSDKEVLETYGLEWDRHLLTTLGVANKRLYEMRIQTSADSYQKSRATLTTISNSFRCREVEQK